MNTQILAAACSEYVTGTEMAWRNEATEHRDPESLILLAEQHGVLPLFARVLSSAGIRCESAAIPARGIAFRNLALTSELLMVIHALQDAGIQALAYKGPALAKQLYADVTLRQFLDLDLLVVPPDALRARDVLSTLGYQDLAPFSPSLLRKHVRTQCEWQMRGDSGILIELHWALFPHYVPFDLCVSKLQRTSVNVEIAGEHVRTLDPLHLVLALAAHGTKHFWSRLGWLVDFALAFRGCYDADAEQLLEAAARKGMKRTLLLSAHLATEMLQLRLPEKLEAAISTDSQAQAIAESLRRVLWTRATPADLLSENILLLRSRERWFDRAKIVWRLAFTPGPEEWRQFELPEWADCLYRPIRLARAARYLPRIAQRIFS
jgi:Uncharacterised nucleotidyltransferase